MRRRKPLRPRTPLQRRKALQSGGKPLKRAALASGKPLERRTALRSTPRRREKTAPPKATQRFRRNTLRRCARDPETRLYICPACQGLFAPGEMECHHVVEQERIKKYVAGLRLLEEHAIEVLVRRLWDARNGLAVCTGCHAAHTNRKRPLSRKLIPESAYIFADEIGLSYVLDRYYA